MSDFVPKQGNAEVITVVAPPVDVLKASLELIKITQDQKFLDLLQLETLLKQLRQFSRIETQAQYSQAIDAFNTCKQGMKDTDALRHVYVDFPTKVVDLINGMFKPVKDGFDATKAHLGKIIDAKKLADEQVAKRTLEALSVTDVTVAQPMVQEALPGVETVMIDSAIAMPGNVVTSERGAKVHTRHNVKVVIKDFDAFIKACVSKNERLLWLNNAKETFIEIKLPVLKALIEKEGKRAVPGVVVEEERVTV